MGVELYNKKYLITRTCIKPIEIILTFEKLFKIPLFYKRNIRFLRKFILKTSKLL